MWVRKRLDLGWSDLLVGLLRALVPTSPVAARSRVEAAFSESADVLACLSVRSGFDLLLGALQFPPKSEILMSALTIPDMARIVEHHGLVAVPVDLDLATLGPDCESLRRAISPESRAIVAAHLCGGRLAMGPILSEARKHGLMVIEDCAQAFDGPGYVGEPEADVSMFSFGPIKTATALGGALVRVRNRGLLDRLRARQADNPVQGRRAYIRRLLKYATLKILCQRTVYAMLLRGWHSMGGDYDRLINGAVRGFPGSDFLDRIRRQPSAPLLGVLDRRLRTYDRRRLQCRAAKGERLSRSLEPAIPCPGRAAKSHNSWVFPIVVENPLEVIAALRWAGFDATQGQSMSVVAPPSDRPHLEAAQAAFALARMVYLPLYPEMPDTAMETMAKIVRQVAVRPTALSPDNQEAPVLSFPPKMPKCPEPATTGAH